MPQAADDQPTYCLATDDDNICTREAHRSGPHKMIHRSNAPAYLEKAVVAKTVADLVGPDDDTATLVPHDPPSAAMQAMNELADITGLIAIDRRFDLLSYQTKTMIAVAQDVRAAKLSLADDRPVDPAVMERIKKRVDGMLLQVGPHDDEAGS